MPRYPCQGNVRERDEMYLKLYKEVCLYKQEDTWGRDKKDVHLTVFIFNVFIFSTYFIKGDARGSIEYIKITTSRPRPCSFYRRALSILFFSENFTSRIFFRPKKIIMMQRRNLMVFLRCNSSLEFE